MPLKLLQSKDFVVFSTREWAFAASASLSAASKQLKRLQDKGIIVGVTRGVWANTAHPYFGPLSITPYLIGQEQGYVSFLTALHLHGMLSQIPSAIHIATTGQPRSLDTPIGHFEFFQIQPELMRAGSHWSETELPYRIATPEKALLDTLYLSTRRGKRFLRLPEIELPKDFRQFLFEKYLNQLIKNPRIRSAIEKRYDSI